MSYPFSFERIACVFVIQAMEMFLLSSYIVFCCPSKHRIPSLTIKTNSYHFCKFSVMKNDSVGSTEGKELEDCNRREPGGMSDSEILEVKRDEAYTNKSCSTSFGGFLVEFYIWRLWSFETSDSFSVLNLEFSHSFTILTRHQWNVVISIL